MKPTKESGLKVGKTWPWAETNQELSTDTWVTLQVWYVSGILRMNIEKKQLQRLLKVSVTSLVQLHDATFKAKLKLWISTIDKGLP